MVATAARTRVTSAYFLRVAVTPDTADAVLTELVQAAEGQGIIVTDQHTRADDPAQPYVSVGFRAEDDDLAGALGATIRLLGPGSAPAWVILTGYGIHRRLVSESGYRPETD